jgi:putative ABC transport system permease protein
VTHWSHLRSALRTLRQHRLRSFLTVLGILVGVAAVVTVIGVGAGSQHRVLERLESLGANLLYVAPGAVEIGGVRLEKRAPTLTIQDIDAIRAGLPMVSAAAPSVYANKRVVYGAQNWFTRIQGTTIDYFTAREWNVASGRIFSAAELASAKKVAVLGESVARELFEGWDPLGKTIRIGNTPFKVIGVLKKKGQAPSGSDQDDKVVIPLSTAKLRILGLSKARPGAVHYAHLQLREPEQMGIAVTRIREVLRYRHRTGIDQPDDFVINDLTEIQESMAEASQSLGFWLTSVAAISLVVGAISIMNVMLVSVRERTQEIGLRRAAGARRKDIRNQFLIEAITLSSAGGLTGLLLGVGLVALIARLREFPILITPDALLLALGSAAAVGIFSGLYPAVLASRLDPIVALRQE